MGKFKANRSHTHSLMAFSILQTHEPLLNEMVEPTSTKCPKWATLCERKSRIGPFFFSCCLKSNYSLKSLVIILPILLLPLLESLLPVSCKGDICPPGAGCVIATWPWLTCSPSGHLLSLWSLVHWGDPSIKPAPTHSQEAAALRSLMSQRKVQSTQILFSHLCSKETNMASG